MLKRKKNDKGIVSLEAAIIVPIFIFIMLFFYGFIIMFMGRHIVSHSMIQSAQSLSLETYSMERLDSDKFHLFQEIYKFVLPTSNDEHFSSNEKWYEGSQVDVEEAVKKRFIGYLAGGDDSKVNDILNTIGIKGGIDAIDFSECTVSDGVLTLTLTYQQEFLFNFQGLASFEREMTIEVNLWGLR